MIIDTDKITGWAGTHVKVCVPLACGLLSWYAAMRWQAALDHNSFALEVFYFFVSASSGITSIGSTIWYLLEIGIFQ